jgi:hypothetical protein
MVGLLWWLRDISGTICFILNTGHDGLKNHETHQYQQDPWDHSVSVESDTEKQELFKTGFMNMGDNF